MPFLQSLPKSLGVDHTPLDAAWVVVTSSAGTRLEFAGHANGGLARVGEQVVPLARMEYHLLQVLVARRRTTPDPERAFMAWTELAEALSFRSAGAESDNVRELVRRVRKKLATLGHRDLIESRQGIGYRLGGSLAA
ncbi:MAG: helix-turn-helix domain-containing protein [Deltaproteobacteria bacterium]|nr:helix-turn-helix domain-containing protein [Deltaproteobacteria bacterium]